MKRRLACVDIPHLALQILLQENPEWKDDAVVVLDKDEANGRILELNNAAVNLGLGKGMLYGPCLGIHRGLKGAVVSHEKLEVRQKAVLDTLLEFSPNVEHSWFQDGSYWLDAGGLSYLFSSVKQWLNLILSAIENLGFECGLALGTGRFGTYAAARLKPAGVINIFSDEAAESSWLSQVPVNLIPMNDAAIKLFKRLKILNIGDVLKLPVHDIAQRISADAARMLNFIKEESHIPLQYVRENAPREWSTKPEEAVSRMEDLHYLGCELIDKAVSEAERCGLQIQSIDFQFIGSSFTHDAPIRPVQPTRNRDKLSRLLKLRIEYLTFENPVHKICCTALFAEIKAPQLELFDSAHHRQKFEAMAVIRSLQAQRGSTSVQFAEITKESLATRRYKLRSWRGFSSQSPESKAGNLPTTPLGDRKSDKKDNKTSDRIDEKNSGKTTRRRLSRRVVLSPRNLNFRPGDISRVVYTGGWWDKPYHYEMGYARIAGRWHWLQKEHDKPWDLVGWVD